MSAIEELLLLLDSPAEPQNLRSEIELTGTPDLARLRQAAHAVAASEPRARVRLARWRMSDDRLAWEDAGELESDPIEHQYAADSECVARARDELVGRPFNLDRSPPWRLGVIETKNRCHLVLVAHHAAIDGQGSVHLLRLLAASYAGRAPERTPRTTATAAARVPLPRFIAAGRTVARLTRQTARVAADGGIPNAPGVHVEGVRLDAPTTAALAAPDGAGMTDLLLASGIAAIARWNLAHGKGGGQVALLHAVGRSAAAGASPLENSWQPTVISLPARDHGRPDLVSLVARRRHAALATLGHPPAAGESAAPPAAPLWLKRLVGGVYPLTGQRLAETAALTCLGRVAPFDFGGDLRSDAFWFDGPARLPKGLFICPSLHGNALHVGLRSARPQLGRDALRRFGELYLQTLVALGGAAPAEMVQAAPARHESARASA